MSFTEIKFKFKEIKGGVFKTEKKASQFTRVVKRGPAGAPARFLLR